MILSIGQLNLSCQAQFKTIGLHEFLDLGKIFSSEFLNAMVAKGKKRTKEMVEEDVADDEPVEVEPIGNRLFKEGEA